MAPGVTRIFLKVFIKSNGIQKLNIVCLSNQLWDFENWTNKRHVMYRLGKLGHNVLFVDPPINTGFVFLRQLIRKNWNLKRIFTQIKKDGKNFLIYTPLNIIPFTGITSFFHIERIKALQNKFLDKNLKTVLWVYNMEIPHLKKYIEGLKYDLAVYDCVDNYVGFPRYDTPEKKKMIEETEAYLAEKSNVVFATAPGLVGRLKKYNPNTFFTPNVGDYERFKDTKKYKMRVPPDLKKIPRPRVGYIGALDQYKFDFDLMKKVAEENPSISFVLIGPIALKDKDAKTDDLGFSKVKNIYYLGTRPYSEKIYYMAGFDADMIPYVLNDYTVGGCFPVKFHDSLAAGLPVVVTDLPAYAPFKDVCYIAKNADEFSEYVRKAIMEDDLSKVRKRQAVAKKNSWDGKVEDMLKVIYRELAKE